MRDLIFWLITKTGLPWALRELFHHNKVTILCFHAPPPDLADKQLRALKTKYNIIPLRQYIDYITGKSKEVLPSKALVITLDDGMKENYLLQPILEKYDIPITIFLCSSIIGTNRHYWWTKLPANITSYQLEQLSNNERLSQLAEYDFDQTKEFETRQALSHSEINKLKTHVDFQSHTCFHPTLPQCSDNETSKEIRDSKAELESKLKNNIYAIAFPNGAYTERELKIVKDCGYECSLTTKIGFNDLNQDRYQLKRIDILDSASTNEVLAKASGAWHLLKKMSIRKDSQRNTKSVIKQA